MISAPSASKYICTRVRTILFLSTQRSSLHSFLLPRLLCFCLSQKFETYKWWAIPLCLVQLPLYLLPLSNWRCAMSSVSEKLLVGEAGHVQNLFCSLGSKYPLHVLPFSNTGSSLFFPLFTQLHNWVWMTLL